MKKRLSPQDSEILAQIIRHAAKPRNLIRKDAFITYEAQLENDLPDTLLSYRWVDDADKVNIIKTAGRRVTYKKSRGAIS